MTQRADLPVAQRREDEQSAERDEQQAPQVGVVRGGRLELLCAAWSVVPQTSLRRRPYAPQRAARQLVCATNPRSGQRRSYPQRTHDGRAEPARGVPGRRVLRQDPHRDDAVARLRARPRRPDPALQRGVRARDRLSPRRAARPRRARLRDPARGARGVRRVPRLRLDDRHAEPAGRPLADQGRRPAADRVVEPADGRRRRHARVARHHRHRPHRPRGAARTTSALEGDPEAKLAEVSRLATEQRALRRVATLVASEVSPERVFMAVSEECARVLQVNASVVVRYEGDGTATIVGRHNRDSIDVFRVGERLPAEEHSAVARVLTTGAPGAHRRLGRAHRRDGRGDLPRRLPLDRGRADRRRRRALGRGRDRQRGPAARRHRGPARRVLRAGLAGRRQRAGARRPDRLARAPRPRPATSSAAGSSATCTTARSSASSRSRSSCASRGRGWTRTRRRRPTLLEDASRELDTGLRGAARDRARPAPGDPRRARASCARWRRSPSGLPVAVDIDADRRAAARAHRGDRLLHRLRGADQRRQARGRRRARASRSSATAPSCAARSPTTAAAAPTRRAAPASSACATAPRRPAGRWRSSARRAAGRS